MGFSRPNAGVGSLSLLQGIFPTQGSNPGLQHCRRIPYQLSHREALRKQDCAPAVEGWDRRVGTQAQIFQAERNHCFSEFVLPAPSSAFEDCLAKGLSLV